MRRPTEVLPTSGDDKLEGSTAVEAVRDGHLDILDRDLEEETEERAWSVLVIVGEDALRLQSLLRKKTGARRAVCRSVRGKVQGEERGGVEDRPSDVLLAEDSAAQQTKGFRPLTGRQ